VVLNLSGKDDFLLPEAHEGMFIVGATGSGKSSGTVNHLLKAFCRLGCGGLITTTKPADTEQYLKVLAGENRRQSAVLFGPAHAARFNPFAYEVARPGDGRGVAFNLTEMLGALMEQTGASASANQGSDPYWGTMAKSVLSHMVLVTLLAKQSPSFMQLKALHASAPRSSKDLKSEHWRDESVFWATLQTARRKVTDGEIDDLELCEEFWLLEYAGLASRTRSIIDSMVSAMLHPFLHEPLRTLFSSETNVCPEMAAKGAIFLLDLPVKLWNEVGVAAQVLMKTQFQRAVERRLFTPWDRTVFLLIDEYQHFATARDVDFAATARSSGVATVLATQNLPILHAAFDRHAGSGKGRDRTMALVGNLANRFLHANSDQETNQWAAEQIGRDLRRFGNVSIGFGDRMDEHRRHTSAGSSEQLSFRIEPHEFARLAKGDRGVIEAIFVQNGRYFATGETHLAVRFRRGG
jgi:type IV secretory pathway TraG/TraD family ATPase VirD4